MQVEPIVRQVQRVVHRCKRQIGKEWTVVLLSINVLDDFVGVELGRVEARGHMHANTVFPIGRRVVHIHHPFVVEVARTTLKQCERLLEPPFKRIALRFLAQVPLASHVGVVARIVQQ
jgi:hypothetical protein